MGGVASWASWTLGVSLASSAWAAGPERRVFTNGGRYLVVEALTDALLHFEVSAAGRGDPAHPIYTTPMVAKTDYPGPTSFNSTKTQVETADLRVTVDQDLCVAVYDKIRFASLQTVCPRDLDQPWKRLDISSPSTQNVYGLGQYFVDENADGDWLGHVWDPPANGYGAQLRSFAGGANDYSMFPIMYALGDGHQGYALFLDQVYKQLWDFTSSPWRVGMWGDQIRWYVIAGPDLPSLRRSYMELTGKPPVPPKRSFGLWVSEFGFKTWDEVLGELQHLRDHHFPVEGFAMDLQWFGGTFGDPDHSRMGSLTWNEAAFPSAAATIKRLADQQVSLMLIEEPYISQTLTEYGDLASHGYLARDCEKCGPTFLNYNPWWGRGGMIDYTNPAGAAYWHDYRRQKLVDMGIHDHWADLGEPEQYNASAWYYGFPEIGKHGQADIHNVYGTMWMASIAEGYERSHSSVRPMLLTRTGTSGIQRYGVSLWSGDIGTNWGNLRSQMHVQTNMSLSGIDYYGSDAGGFQRAGSGVAGGPERLYTQWFADSAMLDVPVRPHGWNLDKQRPTSPSRRGDAVANLANLRLRYELTPYYYSLAFEAHRTGDPVFPPLVHYFQGDANVRQLGSEKMIGRSLLTALAADPDAVTRDVYLPVGEWVDFHTGEWFSSPGMALASYPLYPEGTVRLPLFAHSGAIIPTMPVDDSTLNNRANASLAVAVVPDAAESSFDLYEDDGESYSYKAGSVAITHLTQHLDGDRLEVGIGATQGTYQGMPSERDYTVDVYGNGRHAAAASVDGKAVTFDVLTNGVVKVHVGHLPVTADKHVEVVFSGDAVSRSPSLFLVCRGGQTDPGTSVYAVGSDPNLGSWDPAKAVRLAPSVYPTWSGWVEGLMPNAQVEWKCVKRHEDSATVVQWQSGANNVAHTLDTGYGGVTSGEFKGPAQGN